jgi:hypothetical protein
MAKHNKPTLLNSLPNE